jgi:hypothetical protein
MVRRGGIFMRLARLLAAALLDYAARVDDE